MTTMPRLIVPFALIAALAACSGDSQKAPAVAAAPSVPATPADTLPGVTAEALPQALSQAYGALAEAADGGPAGVFKAKAEAAGAGALPDPEPAVSPALHRAEAALRLALANNAGALLPRETATAQAAYDCWALTERSGAPAAPIDCRALFGTSIRTLWAKS